MKRLWLGMEKAMTQDRIQEIYKSLEPWKDFDGVPPVLLDLSKEELDELIKLEEQKLKNLKD